MKRYIRLLGVLLILFSSCSDFLEEKSQDLIIPKSVKDYREFLFGEAYIRDETQIHTYLDIMTDDVKENIKGSFIDRKSTRLNSSHSSQSRMPSSA